MLESDVRGSGYSCSHSDREGPPAHSFAFVWGLGVRRIPLWKQDNLQELVLSFHHVHVHAGTQTLAIKPGGKFFIAETLRCPTLFHFIQVDKVGLF